MNLKGRLFLIMVAIFSACSVEPVPIEYGKEACHFCKMNIVDNQHAAEIISNKGKAYKYDALECLLNDLKNQDMSEMALILTNTFDAPGELIDVHLAVYLQSENLPSPMGANLNAFKNKIKAESTKKQKGGILLDWQELNSKYSIK